MVSKRGPVTFPSLPRWVPLTGILMLAGGVLGAVMFGLAGNHAGRVPLPNVMAGATVETLTDAGKRFSIDEIAVQPDAAWHAWTGHGYIRANREDAVWVRVTLPNHSQAPLAAVMGEDGFYTDRVDFWERKQGHEAASNQGQGAGEWRHEQSGELTRTKPVWGRSAVFAVDVPAQSRRTFYLRAEDHFAVWLGLSWWPDREVYAAVKQRVALAEGLYYGALFALFFYNAVLWVRLRFPDTGYYLGYLGGSAVFFFAVNGGFPQFITAVGSPVLETVMSVALTLSAASVAQFGRVFLDLGGRAPRADRLARWMRNALLGSLPLALVTPWAAGTLWLHCLIALTLVAHGTMLGLALIAWRAGAEHARYFALAFGFLFVGMAPGVWSFIVISPEQWKMMAFLTGSVLEMLMLSLAVADRFARIQRERAVTQERLVEEMAQRETMQEAYADELALEVGERTRELQEANRDKDRMIAVIGHDLRGPLTALTMGAEQVAGRPAEALGFADEAARTGRQVLLLIEDLVLWARLRAGGVHPGKHFVKDIAMQVVALHQPLAVQRGIELVVSVPETLRVRTDLVLTQTLMRNLVANAVRFARTRVVVGAVAVAGGVRLTVSDDGPGLPPEVGAALAADAGAELHGGAREGGLGLRLCLEISRALDIRLDVKTGAGAEFGFTLPVAVDTQAPFAEKNS